MRFAKKAMTCYQNLAEKLQFIFPEFYKKRFFKKLIGLNKENFVERKAEPEMVWLKNYLKKDDVFIDIGANVGAYIFITNDVLKPENIFGFEPNSQLHNRLRRIFPKNNFSKTALSDENTEAEFKIPIVGGKQIASRGTLQKKFKEKNEEKSVIHKVMVLKFDDWAEKQGFSKIDFIKIDVEGNEMQTLRGAKRSLKKFRPTLMVEMEQRHHPEPLKNLISEIESWNYEAYVLNRENFNLEKLNSDNFSQDESFHKNHKFYINNIIFIPKK